MGAFQSALVERVAVVVNCLTNSELRLAERHSPSLPPHRLCTLQHTYIAHSLPRLLVSSTHTHTHKTTHTMAVSIPPLYRLVYLWMEPVSIFTGAVYAHVLQSTYLDLTHAASAPRSSVPVSTSIVMSQLANLYLGLGLLEACVLRVTSDLKVWRSFLAILLLADVGHLYSVAPVGSWIYWEYWRWNSIDWGNVGFVYFLAITRTLFLLGVGFRPAAVARSKRTD